MFAFSVCVCVCPRPVGHSFWPRVLIFGMKDPYVYHSRCFFFRFFKFVCLFAVRGGQFLRDPVNSNVSKRTDRMDFTYSLDLHFHASHIDANHIGASTYENHIRAFRRPEG